MTEVDSHSEIVLMFSHFINHQGWKMSINFYSSWYWGLYQFGKVYLWIMRGLRNIFAGVGLGCFKNLCNFANRNKNHNANVTDEVALEQLKQTMPMN